MLSAVQSPYLVPFDGSFRLPQSPTQPPADTPGKKALKKELEDLKDDLRDLQRRLYADDRHSVLVVFQAMDAAGKDGTIRHVFSGINPTGCHVTSFKQPSKEELDHDFLWRCQEELPERGRIGVFNRSHYEEVLVVRVHPEYLGGQRIEVPDDLGDLWAQRYESINAWERHLALNGTVILKFWLNIGRDEQASRFLARLQEPEKNWKFSFGDVKERERWDDYMQAYEAALRATSRPWAPWYAIPANNKPYMRLTVGRILRETLQSIDPRYPSADPADQQRYPEMRQRLEGELGASS